MAISRRILLQVTIPAVLIGLALFAAVFLGAQSITRLQVSRTQILYKNVRTLQAAQRLETRLRQLRFHSFLYVMEPTPLRKQVVDGDHHEFETTLDEVRKLAGLPGDARLIDDIQSAYERYRTELVANVMPPSAARADFLRWADAHPIEHLMASCEELLRINWQAIEDSAQESDMFGDNARATMVLLGVLGPISGLIGGFGVAWGLSRSIARLSVRLQDVHAHLEQKVGSVRLTAVGNFHQLDKQLEQILQRVRDVVAESQNQQQEILRTEQLSAVGQLAASVAHEVRNPLMSIKLLVGASLRSQPHSDLQVEDLQVIYHEVERLERKVQALLDFARPPESRRQLCDVGQVLRHAVELVKARLEQQHIVLDTELPEKPAVTALDRDQFTSVLVNLFMNALDAMPHGGRLLVSLGSNGHGELRLSVSDTGSGIDPGIARRLFRPFTSSKATGTGLGLSVCQRVVQEHGGELTGANLAEGGACFTITLPGPNSEVAHADVIGCG